MTAEERIEALKIIKKWQLKLPLVRWPGRGDHFSSSWVYEKELDILYKENVPAYVGEVVLEIKKSLEEIEKQQSAKEIAKEIKDSWKWWKIR